MDPRREKERAQLSSAEACCDDLWSGEYGKGWNRLSITRKSEAPAVGPNDLLLPSGLGNLRMLAQCAGMGLVMTVLYVWVPMMLVNFFVPVGATVYVGILGAAFPVLTVALYAFGTIETQRDRELGGRL